MIGNPVVTSVRDDRFATHLFRGSPVQVTEIHELKKLVSRDDVKAELKVTAKQLKGNLLRQKLTPAEGTRSAIIAVREGLHHPAVMVRYQRQKGDWGNFLGGKEHNQYHAKNGKRIQEPDKFLANYSDEVDQYAVFGCHHKNSDEFPGAFDLAVFLGILGLDSHVDTKGTASLHDAARTDVARILICNAVESLRQPGRDNCTFDEIRIKAKSLAESRQIVWTKVLEQECNDALERFDG